MTKSFATFTAALLLTAACAGACTIPVFRYALDRWKADSFGVAAGDAWKQGEAGKSLAAAMRESATNMSWAEGETTGAGVQLLWPGSTEPLWSGDLGAEDARALLTSPIREEVTKRILAGESAVWVMVDSGEAAKDDAFAKRLTARLNYLKSVAAIPPQDPTDPESRLGPGPELKVGFSMLRVKRTDPQERFLVKMLAGPDGKKLLEAGEPFAAAVFARGRVLGAWDETALDDAGIDEICLFLLGACSCRVKTLNPGWDLLLSADWDTGLMAAAMARDGEAPEEPEPAPEADDPAGGAEENGTAK